jgi:hypothetical protein
MKQNELQPAPHLPNHPRITRARFKRPQITLSFLKKHTPTQSIVVATPATAKTISMLTVFYANCRYRRNRRERSARDSDLNLSNDQDWRNTMCNWCHEFNIASNSSTQTPGRIHENHRNLPHDHTQGQDMSASLENTTAKTTKPNP